jgi:hypothetical protein
MCVVMFIIIPSLMQIAQYTFLPIGSHFVKRLVETSWCLNLKRIYIVETLEVNTTLSLQFISALLILLATYYLVVFIFP